MENRFRREKNISSVSKKNTPEELQKENVIPLLSPVVSDSETFVHDIRDAYSRMKRSRSIKNIVLLLLVSLSMAAVTAGILPKLFAFKFDFTSFTHAFLPSS